MQHGTLDEVLTAHEYAELVELVKDDLTMYRVFRLSRSRDPP